MKIFKIAIVCLVFSISSRAEEIQCSNHDDSSVLLDCPQLPRDASNVDICQRPHFFKCEKKNSENNVHSRPVVNHPRFYVSKSNERNDRLFAFQTSEKTEFKGRNEKGSHSVNTDNRERNGRPIKQESSRFDNSKHVRSESAEFHGNENHQRPFENQRKMNPNEKLSQRVDGKEPGSQQFEFKTPRFFGTQERSNQFQNSVKFENQHQRFSTSENSQQEETRRTHWSDKNFENSEPQPDSRRFVRNFKKTHYNEERKRLNPEESHESVNNEERSFESEKESINRSRNDFNDESPNGDKRNFKRFLQSRNFPRKLGRDGLQRGRAGEKMRRRENHEESLRNTHHFARVNGKFENRRIGNDPRRSGKDFPRYGRPEDFRRQFDRQRPERPYERDTPRRDHMKSDQTRENNKTQDKNSVNRRDTRRGFSKSPKRVEEHIEIQRFENFSRISPKFDVNQEKSFRPNSDHRRYFSTSEKSRRKMNNHSGEF